MSDRNSRDSGPHSELMEDANAMLAIGLTAVLALAVAVGVILFVAEW